MNDRLAKLRLKPPSSLAIERRRKRRGYPVIPAGAFAFGYWRPKQAGIQD